MTLTADDLGVLGHLAVALGVMDDSGNPAPGWLEDPLGSLKTALADDAQREALIAFVDEAMGGADRETDLAGATWLPLVDLDDPALTFAVTLDDAAEDHVDVGLGLKRTTASPQSTSSVSGACSSAARSATTSSPRRSCSARPADASAHPR